MNEIPDHTLKVEMGEATVYRLTCHLTDEAMCHKVCGMHPEGGCGEPEDGDDTPCRTETYAAGCVIAEWVNDGGIDSVEFEHTIEIPVTYEWRASHDYPTIQAAPMNEIDREARQLIESEEGQ